MRYSKQRELVMQTVQNLCDHPTAEEIYDAAVKECPGLSLGTVYRNLNSLVDAGRPTAFFYAEVEFPTVEAARAFVPPPFLGEEKTESGDFSMSAYWHATRGSGREG